MGSSDWNLSNLPPAGHDDVGAYFYQKVKEGDDEKIRLGLEERWRYNHQMFRGDHWGDKGIPKTSLKRLTMNLMFANIQRTVANLVAKQPNVEAIEVGDETNGPRSDKVLTAWLDKWWKDTNQADSMLDTTHEMETYGCTIEKHIMDDNLPDVAVIDPFAFGKAPGVFDDLNDCPYMYHKTVMRCSEIEEFYGLEEGTVTPDETYTEMGEDREEHTPQPYVRAGSVPIGSGSGPERRRAQSASSPDMERSVVIEVWVRDNNYEEYPDGIRVVTITNGGEVVLSDRSNPNINWALYEENPAFVDQTFMFGRFPFDIGNSYRDKTTNWGFSALEQTADINIAIEEIISRLNAHMSKALLPVLILPKDTGIKITHVNNKPGLILRPNTSMQAAAIRYMEPPRVSLDVYKFIDLLRGFFDQIWHIEDADRGERPSGIIAAAAIQNLQERNAVLMRHKIRTIDNLVRNRGRAAISMLQNFGTDTKVVRMENAVQAFRGLDLAGKDYNFVVESGSTVHKTMAQVQEQAVELYRMGSIDRQALLEAVDFPNWKAVIERTGEGQLQQALQILVDAGLEEEEAKQLQQYLMQPGQKQEEGQTQSQPRQEG